MGLLRYQTKTASEKSLQYLNKTLAGYIESHIYNQKDFFTKRYIQQQQKLNEHLANQQTLQSLPTRIIEVVAILQRQAYHGNISYVRQQSFFMYDTLLNNIIFEDAHYNEQRLNEVVDAAGIHAVLNGHTKMDSKIISEHGKNISGGQRQRVALARVLYKDFDLLILDEPCSELDEPSEIRMFKTCKI